ncbi:SDR family oxidoreductase [Actinocrispum sp. NPDC049592]|uniref:SDR family oxidoreductase n=1 Tax=Actinocrispum sp. NPDC049592 TaxID=3154835 RepID=UPI0034130C43
MDFDGRLIVITGGGSGIGAALARRFAGENPRGVVIADKNLADAKAVAAEVQGMAVQADVGYETEILRVIAQAESMYGPVDVWISNAGTVHPQGGPEIGDMGWQRQWDMHVMSHVWAARALLPAMLDREDGYLVNVASCAGLLTSPGAMPYTVTKHAAVALAESLAVVHANTGVRFSCVCPGVVDTPLMSNGDQTAAKRAARIASRMIPAWQAADTIVRDLEAERFLILTHPDETSAAARLRATDPDGYIASVQDVWHAASKGWVPASR